MSRRLLAVTLALLLWLGAAGSTTAFHASDERDSPPEVALADIPAEARETLERIRRGGPFPYRKDGVTFQNREGRLPAKPRGYYREFTVPTPGARDRGARRIVTGRGNEAYYTSDHYRSFRRIRE